jgi:hypothetical protein
MSQHDFTIDNDSGLNVRTDIEAALQALASCSLGTSAPSTTYPGLIWLDTTAGLIKQRNSADSAWTILGTLDEDYSGLIPAGGSAGQVLMKASGTDLDTAWSAPAAGYGPPTPISGSTALISADHAKWFLASITSAGITATLPSAASLPAGWFVTIRNDWLSTKNVLVDAGSGVLVFGAAFSNQTVTLVPGQQIKIITDATNWFVDTPGVPVLDTGPSAPVRGSLNLPAQVSPSAPLDGDIWQVSGAIECQVGGTPRVLGPANNDAQKVTFTITSSADATPVAHSLGRVPAYLDAYLVCTASDAGRAVGDRIKVPAPNDTTHGCSVYASSTNIGVSFGSAASVFQVWSAGALTNLTNSKWQLEIYYD